MKPVTLVLRTFGLTSMLLAGTVSSYAGPCVTDPNASKNESTRYDNEEYSLKQQEVQANVDYENAKLRCRSSQSKEVSGKPTPVGRCMDDAQREFQHAMDPISRARNDNNATRAKARIDIQAASDECNVTGQTPADQQENLRHLRALVDIKKKEVDVNTSYENAKLSCHSPVPATNSYKAPPGSLEPESKGACLKRAEQTYADDKIQLQIDSNNENATHLKNEMAIRRTEQLPK